MNTEEQGKKMSQLIARCWADESFKAKLLADTVAVLKAEGIDLPTGVIVKAVENTDKTFNLVIPLRPENLSDDQLYSVSAGLCGGLTR